MIKQDTLHFAGTSQKEARKEILKDYLLANQSRQLSLLGRMEVFSGKAKFGIFGDGKEIAQITMAKYFRKGDWRAGYYRDQTFVLAAGIYSMEEFFAQLYGIPDTKWNPGNGGRNFNNHFATRSLDNKGKRVNLMDQKNSSSDISPTAGQMPRLLGLAMASKLFRQNKELHKYTGLTDKGNEVAFGSIGDASTSEGHFFETMNAAAVLQIPMAIAVWDDGYGISVPTAMQTVKGNISKALEGFAKNGSSKGILIYEGKGWDYPGLLEMFGKGIGKCRKHHVPVLFHITEMTQPLGHSTSGSHERYKTKERLEWEKAFDPIKKMREWIRHSNIAPANELDNIEQQAEKDAREARKNAREAFQQPVLRDRGELLRIIEDRKCVCKTDHIDKISILGNNLRNINTPIRKDNISAAKRLLRYVCHDCPQRDELKKELSQWLDKSYVKKYEGYNAHLYSENKYSALNVEIIHPEYSDNSPYVAGREILRDNFDRLLEKNPLLVVFGEDVGKIGGVNQTYEGLQEKYGPQRVFDTGIRETSIIGKGIGMALRGLRPIAEIQYFDYLLYALQTLSDDLATTHWRTAAGQSVPLIVSTRGHRLEGVWHAGSPLSMVINSLRGVYVCVPRNMIQAAGFYNTLLEGQDPALVVEPLNGYRLKESRPVNIGEFRVPLGIAEVLDEGDDVTLVTYGSCVRIAQDAVKQLHDFDIHVDLIDVQTLLPFDLNETISESIKKTKRVVFFDEDVPGGATAYMMQQALEGQQAWQYLDTPPRTLTAMDHRPAYTTDGDYFSNPNAENVFETIYRLMHDINPEKYPTLYE